MIYGVFDPNTVTAKMMVVQQYSMFTDRENATFSYTPSNFHQYRMGTHDPIVDLPLTKIFEHTGRQILHHDGVSGCLLMLNTHRS